MGATATVLYTGDLRTKAVHLASSDELTTDAPLDNHGLGQAFSPTDTVATALASCMLTVMGIKARELGLDLVGSRAEVTKIMASNPRRISKILVKLELPETVVGKHRTILERTANTCPVHQSLHPDVIREIDFLWTL